MLLGLGNGIVALVFEDLLPAPLRSWQQQGEWGDEPTTANIVTAALVLAYLLALTGNTVALLLFWRPSREIWLGLVVLGYILAGTLGPQVSFGWESAIDRFACLLEGAAWAVAYCWPPITELFDRPKPQSRSDGVPLLELP